MRALSHLFFVVMDVFESTHTSLIFSLIRKEKYYESAEAASKWYGVNSQAIRFRIGSTHYLLQSSWPSVQYNALFE